MIHNRLLNLGRMAYGTGLRVGFGNDRISSGVAERVTQIASVLIHIEEGIGKRKETDAAVLNRDKRTEGGYCELHDIQK